MWLPPRKVRRTGYRILPLHHLIVGLDILVGYRPVYGHAIQRSYPEVRRVQARTEGGVVNGASTNPSALIVGAELQRLCPAGDAQVFPI